MILTPVLERTLGAWSVFGIAGVCAIAWFAGTAVRHCVRVVEPLSASGELDRTTTGLEKASDWIIVVAYVISVALYLRIMAEYMISYLVADGSIVGERVIACAAVVLILFVGVTRGFHGLEIMDRVALGAVLFLIIVLGAALLWHDVANLRAGELRLPPVPDIPPRQRPLGARRDRHHRARLRDGPLHRRRVLGRNPNLGVPPGADTRHRHLPGLRGGATPVMGLGTADGLDETLLAITLRVTPVLTLPLVLAAVFSQLSAAIADTAAADGNLRVLSGWMTGHRPFLVSGIAAIALAASVPTFTIVVVASRAFAAYYGLQCVVATRTCHGRARKIAYGSLAAVMFAIAVLAEPAG